MKHFVLFDHQGKSKAFVEALAPGYSPIPRTDRDVRGAAFVLTDNDVLSRRSRLESLRAQGVGKVFIYPHAGRPSLVNAFYDPWPHTTAEFVSTLGHIEIMRKIGNVRQLHAVGWSLCPIREFAPRERVERVLFAPIHPRNSSVDKKCNAAVMGKLVRLLLSGHIRRLVVRTLVPFEGSGIKRIDHPYIEYLEGSAGPDTRQIDEADLVVSHQTFAMLAVARGVPTLMMGEDICPHVEYRNGNFIEARGWDEYKDLLMYPLDLLAVDDPLALIERAISSDVEIQDWRKRLIGKPFDPALFYGILESYL